MILFIGRSVPNEFHAQWNCLEKRTVREIGLRKRRCGCRRAITSTQFKCFAQQTSPKTQWYLYKQYNYKYTHVYSHTHTHTIACAYLHVCVGPAPHHQPYIHVKAHSKLIISARAITIVQPPGTKVVVLDFTYSLVAFQVDQCVRFYNGLCTNLTLSHRTPPSPTCVRFTSEVRPRSWYEL